jgi:hypothetical protein
MTNPKHTSQHNPAPSIPQLSAPDAIAGDDNYMVGDMHATLAQPSRSSWHQRAILALPFLNWTLTTHGLRTLDMTSASVFI